MMLLIDSPSVHVEAISCLTRSEIYFSLSPRALFVAHDLRLREAVSSDIYMFQTMHGVFTEEFWKSVSTSYYHNT